MYSNLKNIVEPERLFFDEPMSRHTTFAIGGPADVLVNPQSIEEIKSILSFLHPGKPALHGFWNGQQPAGQGQRDQGSGYKNRRLSYGG
jgi:UDP-N-acetylmuramate dehydrogenase